MQFPITTTFVMKAPWSPDGKSMVCNDTNTALLYDLSTGKPLRLEAEEGSIEDMAFSPHGGLIAVAYRTGAVVFWSRSGKRVHTLRTGKARGLSALAFSQDGRYLAMAQGEDVELAELWIEPMGEYAEATGAAIQSARAQTGDEVMARFRSESQNGVHSLVASPIHDAFAAVAGSAVVLWNLTGEKASTLTGHAAIVRAVAWSRDGQRILTGSEDKTARLWTLAGQSLALVQHESEVKTVAFDAKGETIASGDNGGAVQLSTSSRMLMRAHIDAGKAIEKVAFVPFRELVAVAQANRVRLWDYHATRVGEIEFPDHVSEFLFGADGQWMLARS